MHASAFASKKKKKKKEKKKEKEGKKKPMGTGILQSFKTSHTSNL
jgi:hypothetical protein